VLHYVNEDRYKSINLLANIWSIKRAENRTDATCVNHGRMRDASPKYLRWGMAILPSPQYGWLTGQPSGPQHNQIAPAYSEPIGLVTVDSTSSSFTSISKISISLGVRPLDPLLGLRPWTPLGDFRPPGYLPLCVNPSPQSYRAVDATD